MASIYSSTGKRVYTSKDKTFLAHNFGSSSVHDAYVIMEELEDSGRDDAYIFTSSEWYDAQLRDSLFNGVAFDKSCFKDCSIEGNYFTGCDFRSVDFSGSCLGFTDFTDCDLTGARFHNCDMARTIFDGCTLEKASFKNAEVSGTVFSNSLDLHRSTGLDSLQYGSQPVLDRNTLQACIANLPKSFLAGTGYTKHEIDYLKSIYAKSWEYYSCFISYGRGDSTFVSKLERSLRRAGVNVWRDTTDLKTGDYWDDQIGQAIKLYDKLVLVCSKHSTYRPAVVKEVIRAIQAENDTGTKKLFPIMLDTHIVSEEFLEEAREKVRSGEWTTNWVYHVRKFQIADFTNWKSASKYKLTFNRLLQDLLA